MDMNRRGFLKRTAALGGTLLVGGQASKAFAAENGSTLRERSAVLTDLT